MSGKSLLAVLAALPALLVLGGCGGKEAAVSDVRVCTQAAFDPRRGACTRDESEEVLRGNTFFCSAALAGDDGARPAAELLYEGATFPRIRGDRGSTTAWIVAYAGASELPAGAWECRFSRKTERAEIAFRSAGSEGEILDPAVCRADGMVPGVPMAVCGHDESRVPISGPILCSAVLVGAQGGTARIELVDSAGVVYSEYAETPDRPVSAFSALFEEVEGEYRCRFRTELGTSASVEFTAQTGKSTAAQVEMSRYEDRELPRRAWSVSESLVEPLLGDVASELTGLDVEVRCWSTTDWTLLTDDEYAGYVDFYDVHIHMAPEVCADLATLAYTKRRFWGGEMKLDLAFSVGVLAHETSHFAGAGSNEGVAECYGVQRIERTARLLGATASYGRELASLYWRESYPSNPPRYRARGCRPGGSLDRDPDRPAWP